MFYYNCDSYVSTNCDSIQNGPILNQMTLQEKMVQMAEISSLFPVSSGNVHKEREATNVAGTVDVDGVAPVDVSVILVQ